MAKNKTVENEESVGHFINSIENEQRKSDCFRILGIMQDITDELPKMWGKSIVGFGKYHYKYASGREGDFFLTGFSPRKASLTLYMMSGFQRHEELMSKLGKYKTGKSCLYIKKLEDIDIEVLKELIKVSSEYTKNKIW